MKVHSVILSCVRHCKSNRHVLLPCWYRAKKRHLLRFPCWLCNARMDMQCILVGTRRSVQRTEVFCAPVACSVSGSHRTPFNITTSTEHVQSTELREVLRTMTGELWNLFFDSSSERQGNTNIFVVQACFSQLWVRYLPHGSTISL
jgi:hypothetical protein